ncbi:DASH complex subunit Dad2 [Plasmodiophora brassicae]
MPSDAEVKRRELRLVEELHACTVSLHVELKAMRDAMELLAGQTQKMAHVMGSWTTVFDVMQSPPDETFLQHS